MLIYLFANFNKKNAGELAQKVAALLSAQGVELAADETLAPLLKQWNVTTAALPELADRISYAIVIGGDGTLIRTAKRLLPYQIPTLGINAGRLGFLAGLEPHELDRLSALLTGDYQIEHRMLLSLKHTSAKGEIRQYTAVNDIALLRNAMSHMLDISVFCDGKRVFGYRADGIVFATPTGSTAYSMSAGGPIVDPTLESIIMTPLCPHSLFARSVMFQTSHVLTVRVEDADLQKCMITVDGGCGIPIEKGDTVEITKSPFTFPLLHIGKRTFFEILKDKLIDREIENPLNAKEDSE